MGSFELPLNDYEVYEEIGSGGGGAVYRAFHKNLKKQVVIKKAHSTTSNEATKRAEVDILKNLHHPYLPQVFNYYDINGISYTVMDYIEGRSFGDMLKKGVRFSEKQIIKYATQLCEAVAYLHSRKIPIIHGDIKPDNIMLTAEDNICLIDFNISGMSGDGVATTLGYTPGYGAPEQYRQFEALRQQMIQRANMERAMQQAPTVSSDEPTQKVSYSTEVVYGATEFYDEDQAKAEAPLGKQVYLNGNSAAPKADNLPKIFIDRRSDVYSIGATLFHMYTGKPLSKTNGSVVLDNKASDGLIYILNKALQTNPDDRFKDAGEMLAGMKNLYKHDRKYKRVSALQGVLNVLFVLMIAGGALLLVLGRQNAGDAQNEQYSSYISDLQQLFDGNNAEEFEKIYADAIDLKPGRIEAYRERANMLYSCGKYEEAIKYIDSIMNGVLADNSENDPESCAEIYHTYGNCCFERGDYETAAAAFETAVELDDSKADYYVEYSIALVRTNNISEAKKVLATAEEKNAAGYLVSLTKGEIAVAEGDTDTAIKEFSECISKSDDAYTTARAYIMLGRTYGIMASQSDDNKKEYTDKQISVLSEGAGKVDRLYKSMLLEELAQASIDGASSFTGEGYEETAIDALTEIVDEGWASFTTYNNLVILHQRRKNYDAAKKYVNVMFDLYPGDYRTYKRAAFLEIAVQNERENSDRDYTGFRDYYLKAQEIYDSFSDSQKTDMEMIQLKQAYEDAVAGGWF